jgi:hypothetical protein
MTKLSQSHMPYLLRFYDHIAPSCQPFTEVCQKPLPATIKAVNGPKVTQGLGSRCTMIPDLRNRIPASANLSAHYSITSPGHPRSIARLIVVNA